MLSFKRIDNFLVWGIKGALFLIPFLPLYVTPSMAFPYITGKNFAFRILVEFVAALWLGLIVSNKEYRLRNSAITISILIFTFIVGLADLFGVSPYNSFWSNYERMEGYITILHLALYFIIIRSVLRNSKDWKMFFNIVLGVSAIVSIYALLAPMPDLGPSQFFVIYGKRIFGTIGNPPFLASYLLLSVCFGFILLLNTRKRSLKSAYLFLIVINSVAIYLSASRGAMLAALVGVMIFMLYGFDKKSDFYREKRIKKTAMSVAVILIILSVVFLTFKNADFVQHDRMLSRFATMFSDASGQNRLIGWKYAWEGIKMRPFLGWGQENFIGVYTVNTIPFIREQVWLDRAHNILIDWLVTTGSFGYLSYLAIFVCAFHTLRHFFRKKTISSQEGLLIVLTFAVYFIQNLFTFDTINTYILFFALLAYIDNRDRGNNESDVKGLVDAKHIKRKAAGITLLALLILSFVSYYLNYMPMKEARLSVRAVNAFENDNSFAKLLDDFNEVLALATFGDAHVRQSMGSVSFSIMHYKLFAREGALAFIETAAGELLKGIAVNRHDLKYQSYVINLYKEMALYEPSFISRAEVLIRESIHVNPEYQWLYMALADISMLKKDYESAYINVKKIAELDPENDSKQLKLVLSAIYTLRDDVALSAMENVKRTRRATNRYIASGRVSLLSAAELYQLAEVYREITNIPEALRYYKELITVLSYNDLLHANRDEHFRKPEVRAKLHFETAKMYIALDDKENAVKEAKKAREIDPENFTEAAAAIIYSLNN